MVGQSRRGGVKAGPLGKKKLYLKHEKDTNKKCDHQARGGGGEGLMVGPLTKSNLLQLPLVYTNILWYKGYPAK